MYILCHLADPNNYGTQRVVWCALFCVNYLWSCQNARRSRPSLSTLRSRSSSLEAARAECASMELRTASSAARRVAGARGPRRTCRRCNYQIPAQSRRRSEELTESHLATTKRKPARNGRPAILPSGPRARPHAVAVGLRRGRGIARPFPATPRGRSRRAEGARGHRRLLKISHASSLFCFLSFAAADTLKASAIFRRTLFTNFA